MTTASTTDDLNCINDNINLINDRLYKQTNPFGIAKTVSISTVLIPTSVVGNGTQVTLTINNQPTIPFPISSQITLTGIGTKTGYNGTFTVSAASYTGSTATVRYTASTTGTATTASATVFFSTQNKVMLSDVSDIIVGKVIFGTGITAGTTVSAINTTSKIITISSPFSSTIYAGQFLYFQPIQTPVTNTVVEFFNLFKRKVVASGLTGNPATDSVNQMAQSFESALAASPNSEEVKIVEDSTHAIRLALITENGEVDYNKDDKNIALPLSSGVQVGQTIDWFRTNAKYLIMAQNYTQKAYFSGVIRVCTWLLKWKYNGITYSQWVVVNGPTEDGTGFTKFEGVAVDRGQDTIELLLGNLTGVEYLTRYNKILLNGKPWKIFVIGNMESTNILRLSLQEDYQNSSVDDIANQIADNTDYAIVEFQNLVLGNL